jgi:hypothetical protein
MRPETSEHTLRSALNLTIIVMHLNIDLLPLHRYYSNPAYLITTVYLCPAGLVPIEVFADHYVCDVPEAEVPTPAGEKGAADQPPVPLEVNPLDDAAPAINPSADTIRPPVANTPTNDVDSLPACPAENTFRRENYIFSSLSLIEQVSCRMGVSVNGASFGRRVGIWECKAGYERQHVRRQQYKCVQLN